MDRYYIVGIVGSQDYYDIFDTEYGEFCEFYTDFSDIQDEMDFLISEDCPYKQLSSNPETMSNEDLKSYYENGGE